MKTIRCPICKSNLIFRKMDRIQSSIEHVESPNDIPSIKASYHCSYENCISRQCGIYWSESGERYGGTVVNLPFIDNNDGPFGTISRRLNVEIYKKDENRELIKFPNWFPSIWGGMTIESDWLYKSNEEGEIIKKRLHLRYITKDSIVHIWGVRMFLYDTKRIIRCWKVLKEKEREHERLTLMGYRDNGFYGNEWWRKWSAYLARVALKRIGMPVRETNDLVIRIRP